MYFHLILAVYICIWKGLDCFWISTKKVHCYIINTIWWGILESPCPSVSLPVRLSCLSASLCMLWHSIPQTLILMFREKYHHHHHHVRVFFLSLYHFPFICLSVLTVWSITFMRRKCQKLILDTKVACDLRAYYSLDLRLLTNLIFLKYQEI